jgi:O6-methylguanine-DNA--protein-cysteine methyltransferase
MAIVKTTRVTTKTTIRMRTSTISKDKVTPFQRSVYNLCSQIPKGNVTTYGRIAKALNSSPRAGPLLRG